MTPIRTDGQFLGSCGCFNFVAVVSRYVACEWSLLNCMWLSWIGYIGTADNAVCNQLWMRPEPYIISGCSDVVIAYLKEPTGLKCDQLADSDVCKLLKFCEVECCMPVRWCLNKGRYVQFSSNTRLIVFAKFAPKGPRFEWKETALTSHVQYGSRYILQWCITYIHDYSPVLHALHSVAYIELQWTITYLSAHKCSGFRTWLQCAAKGMLGILLKTIATTQKILTTEAQWFQVACSDLFKAHTHLQILQR